MLSEERWLQAVLFLSLDLTRHFFRDLWVPIENAEEFQLELRKTLEQLRVEGFYHGEDRAALTYQIVDWLQSVCPNKAFEEFSTWIRSIFVFEGPDRPGETLWMPISFQLPLRLDTGFQIPVWVQTTISELRLDLQRNKSEFEEQVDAIDDQNLSDWDRQILALQYSSSDAIVTKTSLIVEYNIFLEAWEKHCSKLAYLELYELWQSGKHVAGVLGMDDLELRFPNSWRFEITNLIRRFCI
jgi:hypothetical protein